MRSRRGLPLVAALALVPTQAWSYTQWTAALTLGGGGRLLPEAGREGLITMGLRADVLVSARDPAAVRVGPYAGVFTDDFATLHVTAGASLLLPVSTTTPLVLSLGALVETLSQPIPVGVVGRVWWGSRSMNLHGHYGMAAGVWIETRATPTTGAVDLVAGLDGDLAFLSLPFVALWSWITR